MRPHPLFFSRKFAYVALFGRALHPGPRQQMNLRFEILRMAAAREGLSVRSGDFTTGLHVIWARVPDASSYWEGLLALQCPLPGVALLPEL